MNGDALTECKPGDILVGNVSKGVWREDNRYQLLYNQETGLNILCHRLFSYPASVVKAFSLANTDPQFPLVIESANGNITGYLLAPTFIDHASPGMVIADAMYQRRLGNSNDLFLSRSKLFHKDEKNSRKDGENNPFKYEFAVHSTISNENRQHQVLIKKVTQRYNKKGHQLNYRNVDCSLVRFVEEEQGKRNQKQLDFILDEEEFMWWEHIGHLIKHKNYYGFVNQDKRLFQKYCQKNSRLDSRL